MKKLIILPLLLALSQAAAYFEFDLDNNDAVILQGKPLNISVGDEIRLVMDENPTDGYRWSISSSMDISKYFNVTLDEFRSY